VKKTLKTLCALNGVSGFEDEVADYIVSRLQGKADEIVRDVMGNVIAFKKGNNPTDKKIMLAAHMDEVGFIVTDITEEGYIKFAAVGGIDRRVIIGKRVRVGSGKVPGVIGIQAIHMLKREDMERVPEMKSLYIDIGAKDKESAEAVTFKGDFIAFEPNIAEFGNNMMKAKAIDDRVGCAALIKLIEDGPEYDVWCVFTVQEEIGTRGAKTAAFRIKPDIGTVVEGTTAADIPSVSDDKKVCRVGGGVVLPFMDAGTIYHREVFEMMRDAADAAGIKWQTKQLISGGTDAAAIQRSESGVKMGGIAAAVRYIHSPSSAVSLEDIERVYAMVREFVKAAGGKR